MRLQDEDHAEPMLDIVPADAELVAERVGRLIEGDKVVADIHVAVAVDPIRPNHAAVAVERRGKVELGQRIGKAHATKVGLRRGSMQARKMTGGRA